MSNELQKTDGASQQISQQIDWHLIVRKGDNEPSGMGFWRLKDAVEAAELCLASGEKDTAVITRAPKQEGGAA